MSDNNDFEKEKNVIKSDNAIKTSVEEASDTVSCPLKIKGVKKKKRTQKIRNLKSSEKDPFISIAEQHDAHKFRIAKITFVVAVIGFICIVTYYSVYNWRKKLDFQKKIATIEENIARIDKEIASNEGYQKYSKILDAIKLIDNAAELDFKNYLLWDKKKRTYYDKLIGSNPVSGFSFVVSSAAIDMVFIPRGNFNMGKLPREPGAQHDELPRRNVILDYDFWIARKEITNSQFTEIVPSYRTQGWKEYTLDKPEQPVARISWHSATAYCQKITEYELASNRIPENYEYRLPTEAEWEYACRAGTETYYFWGNSFGEEGAKFANSLDLRSAQILGWQTGKDMAKWDGNVVTAYCGSYQPNAFGLYDMSGNLWEWCWDWYNPRAYHELPTLNPIQTEPVVASIEMKSYFDRRYDVDTTSKVLRGGSWGNLPDDCRSASRSSNVPEDNKNTGIGFRIVLAPKIAYLTAPK